MTRKVVASNAMSTRRRSATDGIDAHAVAGGAEFGDRRLDALARIGGERLEVDRPRAPPPRFEIGRRRARRRAQHAFRFDIERDVGEPQHLRLRDRAPAGPRHGRSPRCRGRTSSCCSVALTRSEISSRSPDAATLARRTVTANAPLLPSREGLALELRLDQAVDLGERHVDRHRDVDAALLALRQRSRASPGTGTPAWSRSARCASRPRRRSAA